MDARIRLEPLCYSCVRFDPKWRNKPSSDETTWAGYRCLAFPEQIPPQILEWKADHRKPYPGDRGLRFSPKEGITDEEVVRRYGRTGVRARMVNA